MKVKNRWTWLISLKKKYLIGKMVDFLCFGKQYRGTIISCHFYPGWRRGANWMLVFVKEDNVEHAVTLENII